MLYNRSTQDERILEHFLNEEYSGIVSAKWTEPKNHGARKLKINDHNITMPSCSLELFSSISIGDSLSKEKNSLTGYVFTKDSTFILDYRKSIPGMW